MPGDVSIDDVKFILTTERHHLSFSGDELSTDNLCVIKDRIRESRHRLTKALEMLDALIQERELSSLGVAR